MAAFFWRKEIFNFFRPDGEGREYFFVANLNKVIRGEIF